MSVKQRGALRLLQPCGAALTTPPLTSQLCLPREAPPLGRSAAGRCFPPGGCFHSTLGPRNKTFCSVEATSSVVVQIAPTDPDRDLIKSEEHRDRDIWRSRPRHLDQDWRRQRQTETSQLSFYISEICFLCLFGFFLNFSWELFPRSSRWNLMILFFVWSFFLSPFFPLALCSTRWF